MVNAIMNNNAALGSNNRGWVNRGLDCRVLLFFLCPYLLLSNWNQHCQFLILMQTMQRLCYQRKKFEYHLHSHHLKMTYSNHVL